MDNNTVNRNDSNMLNNNNNNEATNIITHNGKRIELVPYIFCRDVIPFPKQLNSLVLKDKESIASVERADKYDRKFLVMIEKPEQDEIPLFFKSTGIKSFPCLTYKVDGKEVLSIGTLVRIVRKYTQADGTLHLLIRNISRVNIDGFGKRGDFNDAGVIPVIDPDAESNENTAMTRVIVEQFSEISKNIPSFPGDLSMLLANANCNEEKIDIVCDLMSFSYIEKLVLFSYSTLKERLTVLMILMNRELEIIHVSGKIQNLVHNEMSRSQREFFLREQLKQISRELGEEYANPDIVALRDRLRHKRMPNSIVNVVMKELDRLAMIPPAAGEYNMAYSYIDWILSLPWSEYTQDKIDINEAFSILERDHFGLKDVKERILEFLSVLQIRKNSKAPIICFVGPPGVGKTSLGKSIAESLGRKFVRISLGGIKDEAEVRGHRRTYIGALPGRIIQGIKKAGTSNPVFMLDELDKVGNDYRGDPSAALLEVLDPQQNYSFNDHYLEVDYDLSKVMFIATANVLDTIPKPLLDRMEVIRLSGYTLMEKEQIAKRYLIPRQMKENGLNPKLISFSRNAILLVIRCYTMESGVRNLERQIASLCRKIARIQVEFPEEERKNILVDEVKVKELLGPELLLHDETADTPRIGVATGMAWTSSGGTTLEIEVASVPGSGALKLTGMLGDVMKESAQTAFTYIRSHAKEFKIPLSSFKNNDFHIHVPDGATPKDGPSAGITLATALYSFLTKKPVQPRLSMTGEITLQGKVTAIGGVREKIIGALSAGIRYVIIPQSNKKDLQDIPEDILSHLTFFYVSSLSDVLEIAVPTKIKRAKKQDIFEKDEIYQYNVEDFQEKSSASQPIPVNNLFNNLSLRVSDKHGLAPNVLEPSKNLDEAVSRTMSSLSNETTKKKLDVSKQKLNDSVGILLTEDKKNNSNITPTFTNDVKTKEDISSINEELERNVKTDMVQHEIETEKDKTEEVLQHVLAEEVTIKKKNSARVSRKKTSKSDISEDVEETVVKVSKKKSPLKNEDKKIKKQPKE